MSVQELQAWGWMFVCYTCWLQDVRLQFLYRVYAYTPFLSVCICCSESRNLEWFVFAWQPWIMLLSSLQLQLSTLFTLFSLLTRPHSIIYSTDRTFLNIPVWHFRLKHTWNLIIFLSCQNTEALYQNHSSCLCPGVPFKTLYTDSVVSHLRNRPQNKLSPRCVNLILLNITATDSIVCVCINTKKRTNWIVPDEPIKELCVSHRWCSVGTAVPATSRSFCVPHPTFPGLFHLLLAFIFRYSSLFAHLFVCLFAHLFHSCGQSVPIAPYLLSLGMIVKRQSNIISWHVNPW